MQNASLTAIVEMPRSSYLKFEVNKTSGRLRLDRELAINVPYNYGYVDGTIAEDGDAVDVFIVGLGAVPPLTEIEIEPVGLLFCLDNGVIDDKLVARVKGAPAFNVSYHIDQIREYLETYKPGFEVHGYTEENLTEYLKRSMVI